PSGLLQTGDPADFIVVTDLSSSFRVIKSYINGEKVYSSKGQYTASRMLERSVQVQKNLVQHMINNFNAVPISEGDIAIIPEKEEDIIIASDGSLFTRHEKGPVDSSTQKLVVLDRYSGNAKPKVAFIKGFSITHGAVAQSIAHDCHNIVAVGSDDRELVKVINRVIEMKGGIAVSDGTVMEDLPLPIAGIISPLCGHELAFRCSLLQEVIERAGCKFHSPFITLAFMCLPVIPELKLTDKGLFDSVKFQFIKS
ncbi:MAG: adenine deaminase, partial [Bacteroidales bacterium]|nr:adenine deaminase [Bacteroidales bacterium]